jgi:NAD(P)-dependent dehydrogenase (short-subunit alcohol dehydrogenase family)
MVTVTGGTLQVPTPLALALDAVGPEANVLITLQNSGAAFTNAVQTGNPVAAAEALLETPANAASSFFFGQQTITESYPVPSGTQYTSADVSVPIGGLLTPLEPVTLTLHSSNGTVTSMPLDGTKFGGLIPGILPAFGEKRNEIESFVNAVDVLLNGVYYTVEAALPALLQHGEGGAIVITSSSAGMNSMCPKLKQ